MTTRYFGKEEVELREKFDEIKTHPESVIQSAMKQIAITQSRDKRLYETPKIDLTTLGL